MSDYGERRAHNVLRNGDDVRRAISRLSIACKVQVQLVLQYPLREVPHTERRVLHGFAKKTPAQEVVIQRNAHIVNEVRALSPLEEIQVMPPAGEEKLPLHLRGSPGIGIQKGNQLLRLRISMPFRTTSATAWV